MRRLQIADAPTMILALQDEIARSEEARYDHRLHGVLLAAQGMSCYEVAELLGQHPTTVERWVLRFEARGFGGLQERERAGRPRRLDEATWQKIQADLRREPRALGHSQNLWDGKLLSHHLRQGLWGCVGRAPVSTIVSGDGFSSAENPVRHCSCRPKSPTGF